MTSTSIEKAPGACNTEGFGTDTSASNSATSGTPSKTLASTIAPSPDKAAILATFAVLFDPGDVIELRAFPKGRKRTDAGYFDVDHWDALANHAARLSASGAAVYITLNPVDPQLLSRYSNRIEAFATSTTTDKQVIRRRWLLIDLDPVRPSDTSATSTQLEAAHIKARAVYAYLVGIGWPTPLVAKSGNGYHLLCAIDLPNDEAATALVKAVLLALGERFDDAHTQVDRSVFNAARICKLYGTVANKGDHTAAAPWRLSCLLQTPARTVVSVEQLAMVQAPALAAVTVAASGTRAAPLTLTTRAMGSFNLEDFLARHGMPYISDQHDGRERFKLAACPFNPVHINGDAAIFRKPSGELGFKCQHDSCASKGWREVRESLDGSRAVAINTLATPASFTEAKGRFDTWPEPTPLPNALPPVDPFDAELLPVALRDWVMDIAHRMQCPADFPAVTALVALSSLIGARAVVQPKAKDDWQVVPNLWGAVVGRPGVKKSPALGEALKPLQQLQKNEFEAWQFAHAAWELDSKVAAMQGDGNEKKAKGLAAKDPVAARALLEPVDTPAEPLARRFIVNDATVEKLGELLQQNPWGTLSYRDELYSLLTSLDKQGQEGARGFYLQSYDGDKAYTFDRIIRGSVHIPRVCLAMIGGIQPGRIQEYVRGAVTGGSADDGLLQRFGLAVWPDVAREFIHVDQWPDMPAKQTAWAVFERLAALQPASETEPFIWRFDDAAQVLFVEWLVPFEIEIRGDMLHPAMVSHLSKYRKLIPALALVFALIDTPESGGVIHQGELMRALAWGDYLRSHANRLYAAAVMPETTDAATLLSKIRAGKLADSDGVILESFTPRQIAVKGWTGLDTPDAVRNAAKVLADYDFLRLQLVPSGASGGRPSERYAINPAVLKGGAAGNG